jgi:hypothetical protein
MSEANELAQIEQSLEECVRRGWMQHAGVDEQGRKLYTMTDAGKRAVEQMGRPA